MRVLVTGHNGYIGSVLVPVLEQAGNEVFGVDSDLFAACTFGPDAPEADGMQMDVRDIESEDLVGFDAVIHLAAVCNDPVGDLNPQATYEINHLAAVRMAEKAKKAGVTRFLFSSSCSLYGKAGEEMLDENGRIRARDAIWPLEGARREGHLEARRRFVQSHLSCATPPHTASRHACASTWSSTTSSDMPTRRGGPDPERRDAVAPPRARR